MKSASEQSHTTDAAFDFIPVTGDQMLDFSLEPGDETLRWVFVVMITLSTIINVIDSNTLFVLAPSLQSKFHMSNAGYSYVVDAYLVSFTVMYTGGGWLVDRVGEKLGMGGCVFWWSVASTLHSVARGALSLGFFRFLLGVGAPGNYPGALRVCTTWFSKEERGLPVAIFSSSSSLGSIIAVPMVTWLTLRHGWQSAFLVTGFLGLIWTAIWTLVYRLPRRPVDSRGTASGSDNVNAMVRQKQESPIELLKNPNVRAIVACRLVSDPVWLFYLSWTPLYLAQAWGYSLRDIGLYAWIPFIFGGAGGVFAGVASDWLIRRGLRPARARKVLLYSAGTIAPLGMLIAFAGSARFALALIGLMAFVSYIWYINTATLIPDVFPARVVGSVLGLMGTAGTLLGIIFTWFVGFQLDRFHSWKLLFVIAGSGHLLGSIILFRYLNEKQTEVHAV